ncbi:L-seryl-tRNA(Sec) kinase [Skeletonema marinoi]|uniref:L-seryl-tRNA(Sec) kinase n=1 Tax=Skeletonema marinoi TaxID=267567 RepID=A0AAD8YL36_9STRA|nr:L-seryl-tRNA(Sec) kinase [Skeletonema marinoi]
MNMPQNKASILLFCGLPGSGKSTIARDVAHIYSKCGGDDRVGVEDDESMITQMDRVVIIDYDVIAEQESSGAGYGISGSSQFTSDDLEAWRKSRITALDVLKNTLYDHFSSSKKDDATLLVVMDDNFHLRSMRREVYRACQDFLVTAPDAIISFSIAYISAPLNVCLRRNDSREGKQHIPSHVITRMDATIEPPDESKPYASFEKFHLTINNTTDNAIGRKTFHDIEKCINESLQSPIQAKKECSVEEIAQMEQERERQRLETFKCKSQRIYLLLRRLVGAVGRVDKKRSKEANETRKDIIERVRIENNVGSMSDECIVQQFASKMLGIEASDDWQAMNTPLTSAIQSSFQEFLSHNRVD